MSYRKHIFFCTNQKDNGKKCCALGDAPLRFTEAREFCREHSLKDVRINQSGCLGRCAEGPCLVVYPEGRWYRYDDAVDVKTILEAELIDNKECSDLQLLEPNK